MGVFNRSSSCDTFTEGATSLHEGRGKDRDARDGVGAADTSRTRLKRRKVRASAGGKNVSSLEKRIRIIGTGACLK